MAELTAHEDSRLLLGDGTSLANLLCIGLGTGYRLPARMGGEPNFDGQANSLWLYQNDIGEVIYRAIHRREAEPADQILKVVGVDGLVGETIFVGHQNGPRKARISGDSPGGGFHPGPPSCTSR